MKLGLSPRECVGGRGLVCVCVLGDIGDIASRHDYIFLLDEDIIVGYQGQNLTSRGPCLIP